MGGTVYLSAVPQRMVIPTRAPTSMIELTHDNVLESQITACDAQLETKVRNLLFKNMSLKHLT